jgi:hypothetical protein
MEATCTACGEPLVADDLSCGSCGQPGEPATATATATVPRQTGTGYGPPEAPFDPLGNNRLRGQFVIQFAVYAPFCAIGGLRT